MRKEHIDEMTGALQRELLERRSPGGMWRGGLSSSAVSTAVSVFALHITDSARHASHVENGALWLRRTMLEDGSWGDSVESPANLTATLLSYASLCALGDPPAKTKEYIAERFGGITDKHIVDGVLAYYGSDLTFSAPILVMCALAGVISTWDDIPRLPFEASVLPQGLFRFLGLPVVSYAIPALIAVGILRFRMGRSSILSPLREAFVGPSLETLEKLQPSDGGFLEAAPLTAFVAMCMTGAGYKDHPVTRKAIEFLTDTVRADGSWPIDTDLACWVTSLAARALGDDLPDRPSLAAAIRRNAFAFRHPFTGAKEGGWGWSDLPGAVPDADDTAGALVALHALQAGIPSPEIEKGVEWLLALQNTDGGMPTFCKGWGKLPFDRSSPDISAHAIAAFSLWADSLSPELGAKCRRSISRMLRWMERNQTPDGWWTPLWFGDQDSPNEQSPVYGTATAVEYLASCAEPLARSMAAKGIACLLSAQNRDGGWGGAPGIRSKVTLTSRVLAALASHPDTDHPDTDAREATDRGLEFIYSKYKAGELLAAEPIGLYFSRLWYSEELYNIVFALNALKKQR